MEIGRQMQILGLVRSVLRKLRKQFWEPGLGEQNWLGDLDLEVEISNGRESDHVTRDYRPEVINRGCFYLSVSNLRFDCRQGDSLHLEIYSIAKSLLSVNC